MFCAAYCSPPMFAQQVVGQSVGKLLLTPTISQSSSAKGGEAEARIEKSNEVRRITIVRAWNAHCGVEPTQIAGNYQA